MALRLGENGYYQDKPELMAKHGDLYHISVDNLHTRALTAILTACTIKNFHASNIYLHTDAQYVWTCGGFSQHPNGGQVFIYHPSLEEEARRQKISELVEGNGVTAENILIENVYHTGHNDDAPDALFVFNSAQVKNAVVRGICCDEKLPLTKVYHTSGKCDVCFEKIVIAGEKMADSRL